jgi:hypothetical protein
MNGRTKLFRQAENAIMEDVPWVPVIYHDVPRYCTTHGCRTSKPHPSWIGRYEKMWIRQ